MQLKTITILVMFNLLIGSMFLVFPTSADDGMNMTTARTVDPSTIFLKDSGFYPDTTTISLEVTGYGGTTTSVAPLDVVFAIDTSGSMRTTDPDRLRVAAARAFVDKLDPTRDTAGVVGWDLGIDLNYGLTDDFATLKHNIGLVDASGGTDLDVGLRGPINMLDSTGRPDAIKVIIFLSDGGGNYKYSGQPGSLADDARSKGYTIYSIGLRAADQRALRDMAVATGGAFFDSPTAANLEGIFNAIYTEILISTAPENVDLVETTMPYIVDESDFSIVPDSIMTTGGITVIKWFNIATYVGNGDSRLTADETFVVTYTAKSTEYGLNLPVAVDGESVVNYINPNGNPQVDVLPQGYITVYQPIEIDIKPGSYPNSINLRSRGVLPVAILTTDTFDASTVDPSTIEFEGAMPLRWNMEDVDGDGDLDMILHFRTQQLDLTKDTVEGVLIAYTNEGAPLVGSDSIRIVPPRR